MSSEAITQNDLREILSRTVGSIPSEYKKLLWTNPSPSADFPPQTKLFDLSGYDEVEIVATFLGDTNASYSTRCAVGAGSNLAYQILNTATATNASTFINGVAREFTVSTSGITFSNGQMTYNGSAYTNWQARAIPYKIYGIKYERVAPPQVDASDYVIEQGTSGDWRYRKWESGMTEMWFYKLMSVPGINTTIAVPSNLTINTSHIRTEQVSGSGDGFVGDIHHLWVTATGTEVYVTPSPAGTYAVSLYIVFDE